MARYKLIHHLNDWYGLRRGETLEQLLQLEKIESLLPSPTVPETKTDYWISTPYGLVRRSSYRRSHHRAKQFIDKPRFGPGSGRQGGGRTGSHFRSHVRFYPGTGPSSCPICLRGLSQVLADQGKELMVRGRTFWAQEAPRDLCERTGADGESEEIKKASEGSVDRTMMIDGRSFRWYGKLYGWQDSDPMSEVEL